MGVVLISATVPEWLGNMFIAVLLLVTKDVLCVPLAESPRQNGSSTPSRDPVDCSACPNQVYNPVNNIQITNCDAGHVKPTECNTSGRSSCDELLHLGKTQLAMTSRILEQLDDLSHNQPVVDFSASPSSAPSLTHHPRDCSEVQSSGQNLSGRYAIYPADDQDPLFVFCDMETAGGGWTVFQRRQDGSVDFYLKWLDYKYGFGSVEAEHWLGNEKIHRLTSQKAYILRIDLENFVGERRYAEYDQFIVAEEALDYQLILGDYKGNAGDSMAMQRGMKFSTHDRDEDVYSDVNCAQLYKGAWWYKTCHHSNLNGRYLGGQNTATAEGVTWYHWHGYDYSLKRTEMKILPLD